MTNETPTPTELRRLLAAADPEDVTKGHRPGCICVNCELERAAMNALPGLLDAAEAVKELGHPCNVGAILKICGQRNAAEAKADTLQESLRSMARNYSEASMEVERLLTLNDTLLRAAENQSEMCGMAIEDRDAALARVAELEGEVEVLKNVLVEKLCDCVPNSPRTRPERHNPNHPVCPYRVTMLHL